MGIQQDKFKYEQSELKKHEGKILRNDVKENHFKQFFGKHKGHTKLKRTELNGNKVLKKIREDRYEIQIKKINAYLECFRKKNKTA